MSTLYQMVLKDHNGWNSEADWRSIWAHYECSLA
jgi:hypothetical protein